MSNTSDPAPAVDDPPADPPPKDSLDRATTLITRLGALVAAVVGLNTLLTTCASDTTARYATFRTSVSTEETYWKDLYKDYLDTFDSETTKDPEQKKAKLFAIANLANHEVPDFAEFSVPQPLKVQAQNRLQSMRKSLIDALQDKTASGDAVADAARNAAFLNDEATAPKSEDPAQAPVTKMATVGGAASLSYQTQVLTYGKHDNGWDIDVFWCQGVDEEAYYAKALAAAQVLADQAASSQPVASGVSLGRIRLRSLPAAFQDNPAYAAHGVTLVYDRGPGEQAAAAAIQKFLAGKQPKTPFSLVQSTGQSKWYLSAFVCPALSAATTPPGYDPARVTAD